MKWIREHISLSPDIAKIRTVWVYGISFFPVAGTAVTAEHMLFQPLFCNRIRHHHHRRQHKVKRRMNKAKKKESKRNTQPSNGITLPPYLLCLLCGMMDARHTHTETHLLAHRYLHKQICLWRRRQQHFVPHAYVSYLRGLRYYNIECIGWI